MAELIGVLSAASALAKQSIALLEDLKMRYDATKSQSDAAADVLRIYKQLSDDLAMLERSSTELLSAANSSLIEPHMLTIKQHVKDATESLEHIKPRLESSRYAFTRAARTDALLAKLTAKGGHCKELVLEIFKLLAPAQAAAHQGAPAADPALPTERYSGSVIVESNEHKVVLDFDSEAAHGAALTPEGRLKRLVLRDGRANRSVGCIAVGPAGVGKTCALRAIALLPQVRDRFPDGMFFRRLQHGSGAAGIIGMLAAFVRHSGGSEWAAHVDDAATLHDAVERTCKWFRGKTCLFVVDDICASEGMISDVLAQLSQLAECGSASEAGCGCVLYSTRDRAIAAVAGVSAVEFDCWQPAHARTVLLEVAGEGIDTNASAVHAKCVDVMVELCEGLAFNINIAGRLAEKKKKEWGTGLENEAWKASLKQLQKSGMLKHTNPAS